MSFLVPKKPQILYAPMLASFGGGSARGFNPGGGGGGDALTYIARVTGVADEQDSFPSTNFMNNTWSHNGGNADGGTINLSGSGQYQLHSISMGKRVSSSGNVPTIQMKVYAGDTATNSELVSSQSITYPAETDTSSPYQCQELVFPTPVTLSRGTTYAVAYGMSSPGLQINSGAINGTGDGIRTSYSLSGGGTLTFGDMTFNDTDPFDASNGTGFTSATNGGSGQLPVFGFIL